MSKSVLFSKINLKYCWYFGLTAMFYIFTMGSDGWASSTALTGGEQGSCPSFSNSTKYKYIGTGVVVTATTEWEAREKCAEYYKEHGELEPGFSAPACNECPNGTKGASGGSACDIKNLRVSPLNIIEIFISQEKLATGESGSDPTARSEAIEDKKQYRCIQNDEGVVGVFWECGDCFVCDN